MLPIHCLTFGQQPTVSSCGFYSYRDLANIQTLSMHHIIVIQRVTTLLSVLYASGPLVTSECIGKSLLDC